MYKCIVNVSRSMINARLLCMLTLKIRNSSLSVVTSEAGTTYLFWRAHAHFLWFALWVHCLSFVFFCGLLDYLSLLYLQIVITPSVSSLFCGNGHCVQLNQNMIGAIYLMDYFDWRTQFPAYSLLLSSTTSLRSKNNSYRVQLYCKLTNISEKLESYVIFCVFYCMIILKFSKKI